MKEQLPLSPEDIGKLRKQLIPMLIFPFAVVAMFAVFYKLAFRNMDDSFFQDGISEKIFMGFGVLFLSILSYMVWTSVIDIKRGFKYRVTGVVTDKRLNVQTSSSHGSAGGRSGSSRTSSSTTRHYYLYINDEEFSVDYKHYTRVKVGSNVVLDRAPKSRLTLSLTVLSKEVEDPQASNDMRAENIKFLESQMQEERFSEKDFEALKKIFRAQTRKRLLFMLPFVVIVFGMITNGLLGFLIIMFPLFIVPLWQGVSAMRRWGEYIRNKGYAHKRGVTALVEDKLTVTGNRRRGVNKIITTKGTLPVSTVLYDQLSVGEKVIIFFPKYGKQPLSIMKLNKEEFYLF
jgi:hypothetical protein